MSNRQINRTESLDIEEMSSNGRSNNVIENMSALERRVCVMQEEQANSEKAMMGMMR